MAQTYRADVVEAELLELLHESLPLRHRFSALSEVLVREEVYPDHRAADDATASPDAAKAAAPVRCFHHEVRDKDSETAVVDEPVEVNVPGRTVRGTYRA